MATGPSDTRVLVVTNECDDPHGASDIASVLADRLPGQTVVKCEATAAEYLAELGPTVDCVVSLSSDISPILEVAEMDAAIPLVVYGDDIVSTDVDAVIPRTASVDDVVARVETEVSESRETNRLEEVNAKLTALSRYAKEITGCETVQDVCSRTIDATVDALDFDYSILALVDGDQIVPYGATIPPEEQRPIGISDGIAGRTLEMGESQVVDDMQSDPDATFKHRGYRAVMSVPISDRGVLQVVSEEEAGAYDDRDVEFLETLAGYTNEALARLERETALRTERDRFHALFDGLSAPTAYVESDAPGDYRVREINAAYERTFPNGSDAVGASVSEALPTERERRLVEDQLRGETPVRESVERTVRTGEAETLSVTLVPVQHVGPSASGFLVYRGPEAPLDESATG
ncbi:GAF domain-containing protein [Halopelagius inordinatus]|uniref:GAF domain-containing protein n=1 Tax=Halopelagius inordinatus TaxID=553467 RepID=A0A1I2MTZ7_9EURY|nr:GAF domain-containing protein [Halopelagius inordinatus]SFF94952.1 GAF domain-containing protein [Halopelagius inordinatus]